MSLILTGIPASLTSLVQDGTLNRVFNDALYPYLQFRGEAVPELWPANLGERQIFTRVGLMQPRITPLVPGQDPTPHSSETEQWEATAAQYGDSNDTHMPTSYVALASLFTRNTVQLALNGGQTLNRLVRNRLFSKYLEGEAMVLAPVSAGGRDIRVSTLNGFVEKLYNGKIQPVSPANPMAVTFTTSGEPANTIVGYSPDNPDIPLGSGTITLSAALTAGVAARDGIFAATRSRRYRVGGGATVDSLTAANTLTLDSVIAGVTRLRAMNVPPHVDGYYHVQLPPEGEQQIFTDNHWQRLHQSLPDSVVYRDLAIGAMSGCVFYRNTETPQVSTVGTLQADAGGHGYAQLAPEIGGELTNENGVTVRRTIITGGGAIYEKYLDESQYITQAGVNGQIGQFSITNNGIQVMTNRIRYIIRSPQDRMQQMVSQTWSWSGDFPVPSDALTGDSARYKRAVVIEHG